MYYQNVRGLRSKTASVYNSITACNYDIISFSETNLGSDILDCELFGPEYTVLRSDRDLEISNLASAGGVLLAVRQPLAVSRIDLVDATLSEFCGQLNAVAGLVTVGAKCLYIVVLYIRPGQGPDLYSSILEVISTYNFLHSSDVLIVGDFNISEYSRFTEDKQSTSRVRSLQAFVSFFNFTQRNTVTNSNNRLLDLVLSNMGCNVQQAVDVLTGEDIHHPSLVILTPCASVTCRIPFRKVTIISGKLTFLCSTVIC